MGRFGQPRYKDPLGTPAALRGIREVTDKNKHILLEAIFNADFIPDHLLPVGIHRCGQQRWRAHLCTVGLKFSGPPRENVREACEDRRKFCEENGVNFVLYGKQTHAKGPIGSRPSVSSGFPRLSDYVSSLTRSVTAGSAGNSQMILASMKNNSSMRPFFEAVENAKRILKARKGESEGTASYVVTESHAALHKRIIEDSKDKSEHVYRSLRRPSIHIDDIDVPFTLCPIKVQYGNIIIRFLWDASHGSDDAGIDTYLRSILCNTQPPLSDSDQKGYINRMIMTDIMPQLQQFKKVNEKIKELISQHGTMLKAIKLIHQNAPHPVNTRKNQVTSTSVSPSDNANPFITISVSPTVSFEWNSLTPDSVSGDFSKQLEHENESIMASDALFVIVESSLRHRISLFQFQSQITSKKPTKGGTPHDGLNVSEEDLQMMEKDRIRDEEEFLSHITKRIRRGY